MDFQFREANDEILAENLKGLYPNDSFMQDPTNSRMITRQVLDINTTYPLYQKKEKDEKGCLRLCTTGGGHYALPIRPDDAAVVVVNYLTYSEQNGVCNAADFRLIGFEPLRGGKQQ